MAQLVIVSNRVHGVAYGSHRKVTKAVDNIDVDLCMAGEHSKADSHWMSPKRNPRSSLRNRI
jgi:hypothetical protein